MDTSMIAKFAAAQAVFNILILIQMARVLRRMSLMNRPARAMAGEPAQAMPAPGEALAKNRAPAKAEAGIGALGGLVEEVERFERASREAVPPRDDSAPRRRAADEVRENIRRLRAGAGHWLPPETPAAQAGAGVR